MSFDYSSLDEEQSKTLLRCAERIKQCSQRLRDNYYEIGRQLLIAKAMIPHGSFIRWYSEEFSITQVAANRYMRAARWAEVHPDIARHVPASISGEYLSTDGCPEGLLEEIVRHINENGSAPSTQAVRASYRARKNEQKIEKIRRTTRASRKPFRRTLQQKRWEAQREALREDRERRSRAADIAAGIICQLPNEVLEELKQYLDKTDGISLMDALKRHLLLGDNIESLRSPHLMA